MATPASLQRVPRRPASTPARALTLASLLAVGGTTPLAAQGLTLRMAPEAQGVRWDEGLGLKDATFLGGGLSLGFGRYVTLKGGYGTAGVLGTSFAAAGFTAEDGSPLAENDVRASLFEGGVLVRLGNQRVAPILSGRGGILSLEPDGRERARQILAGYGAGLDLRLTPWLDGQVRVERVSLRLDRQLLTREEAGAASDPERDLMRTGTALGASLGVRLGGARSSGRADDIDQGFGRLLAGDAEGLMVPLETHVGAMRFDDALGLPDQRTAGVRGGFDLGPYFGVRGYYWKGVTDAFDAFQGISGWSGEVQFNLGRVTQASPHLILGAGQTRFTDDFLMDTGVALENQNQLIVGAGLGIPLGDRTRLAVTLRDHISASGDLQQTAAPSDLRHSVSLSGGLSVLLFGRRTRPGDALPVAGTEASPQGVRQAAASVPPDSSDYRSGQILAIPLPREGELYVRYGPGGRTLPEPGSSAGVDSTAVSLAVLAEREQLIAGGGAALGDSARATLEARVLARVRALAARDSSAVPSRGDATLPTDTTSTGADVAELRRQVADLTRLVRESMVLQAAGTAIRPGDTSVTVVAGADAPATPFLRALEGRLARTSMDDGHGGVALNAEAYLGSVGGNDDLIPFVALDVGRNGVGGLVEGAPASGSVRTLGLDFGVTRVLPSIGPVWPTLSLFFSAARERVSGDTPPDEEALDRRYGGLSMGPGIAFGAGYRPDPGQRTLVTGALRKVWSGSTSRWSVEAGMRLAFGPNSGMRGVGPFSVSPPSEARSRDTVRTDTVSTGVPPTTAPTVGAPTPDSVTSRLLARVDSLEAHVLRETEARQRAQARADSLAAAAVAASRAIERARTEAEARRSDLLGRLEALAASSGNVVTVQATNDELLVVMGGALFGVGAMDIGRDAREEIQAIGGLLARLDPHAVAVQGHTDSTGTQEANLVISRRRAESVAQALVGGGLPAALVTAEGVGPASPVADNTTRAGRAQNRRVEIRVRHRP